MYTDVLIPVDRGKQSNLTALNEVLDFIGKTENGTIRLLYVWTDKREQETNATRKNEHPYPIEHAREHIKQSNVDVNIECETRIGHPSDEISAYADETDVDAIAMATYGRSGVKRMLLGSTTENTIKQSTPPVLVVNRD